MRAEIASYMYVKAPMGAYLGHYGTVADRLHDSSAQFQC